MRMAPHVMLALTAGSPQRAMYERWITVARPPLVKVCRQSCDNALLAWTRAQGSKTLARYVDVALVSSGAENGRLARKVIGELTPYFANLDYIEFANEELQGKDDPRQWDILMAACLDFMQQLDAANKAAGRKGPKACIANTSVGQPELERWSRPSTLETARYAAANGHVWGLHAYYKPDPWAMIEGGKAAWDGTPPARGWLMLRETQARDIMRQNGIDGFRFIITESGRDNVPGQPGPGGGFRDVPGEPYAERMAEYGRHLSAIPECIGWVDFGYNAWEGWKQFDLTEDEPMHERMVQAMAKLPRGAPSPPAPQPAPVPPPVPVPPTPPEPQPMDAFSAILRRKLGNRFSDDRAIMPRHATARYSALNPAAYKGIAIHHSAAPRGQAVAAIADYHVTHNGWAGIGYHVVIRQGVAHYVGDIATQRAHVAGRNHELAGVCVTGDYTKEAPRTEDLDTLRLVIEALDELLGKALPINGHGGWALAGHKTECPGALVGPAREIRSGAPTQPAPAPTPTVDYRKVVWAVEQGVRILEGEGRALDAGFIRSTYLADAIKLRDKK